VTNHEIAVQPAVAADRFAREIVRILGGGIMRLRRLMGNPLGHGYQCCISLNPVIAASLTKPVSFEDTEGTAFML
jgi:hypothetical protein